MAKVSPYCRRGVLPLSSLSVALSWCEVQLHPGTSCCPHVVFHYHLRLRSCR
ncbi:hypothetical protein PF005_g19106 [Phytophthora fragariae]|uniref:Uncharacterized protein n=2 Tax=Phytophthora TaxID=4783 RepID=A0A6A3SMC6_9STRA|nr:hypothetical protein PF003_g3561 [Phytophthora fragariae]KAE9004337.1 hypothetical protein PR001_g17738 [Phytophthora rubi]KAE8930264.1 hypothetical protein PF009_g19640 [Phytophthora fragariae]KAE8995357.1 hypothetical protein PF011_g16364 [Phytophthora fragariae]KAE9009928.1 hypothetical protein PR002_g15494 [Phytophthora rubi]